MRHPPIPEELERLPQLFSNLDVAREDLLVHMRFYHANGEWYATEYSPTSRTFFGYSIHRRSTVVASWGLFGLDELIQYVGAAGDEIERDTNWIPVRARDIPAIRDRARKRSSRGG